MISPSHSAFAKQALRRSRAGIRPGVLAACSLLSACASAPTAGREPSAPAHTDVRQETTSAHDPAPLPDGGAIDTFHGVEVSDPFRWLEGRNAAVESWVDAEDRKARTFLAAVPEKAAFVTAISHTGEYAGYSKFPVLRGHRYFYEVLKRNEQYTEINIYDRTGTRLLDSVDLDPKKLDGLTPSWWSVSPDGRYIVFRLSANGNDEVQARIYDVRARAWLLESIDHIRYSVPQWNSRSTGFYYTWSPGAPDLPAADRAAHSSVRYHRLRTAPETDERLRPPPEIPGAIEIPSEAPDGRWLAVIRWYSSEHTSIFLHDNAATADAWEQITPDGPFKYNAAFGEGTLYVQSNDGAPRGQLFKVDARHPTRGDWRTVLPEQPGMSMVSADLLGQNLIVKYLKDAEPLFELHRADGSFVTALEDKRFGSLAAIDANSDEAFALFNSYTDPPMPRRMALPKPDFLPLPFLGEHTPARGKYVMEKIFYTSPDGTRAPIFVVHAPGQGPHLPAPLVLSGYGTLGESTAPHFIRGLDAWLDRGGVYAEAVVRGGGEYGSAWHEAGRRHNRGNSYADFIAASELLVSGGWTTASQLVTRGGSGGGLLVTAAATLRPDLYAGVVAEVPVTDMIRFHTSGIGSLLVSEYGTPDDRGDFPVLLRYSPYHTVRRGVHYPAFYLLSHAADDRVDPWHARKFAAAVEAADPSDTVLLQTEKDATHESVAPTDVWVDTEASIYAFALAVTRARKDPSPEVRR